jgi:hydrogenase maturation protein HypF
MSAASASPVARKIILSGHVQSVGFRPFIYRLAIDLELTGWVQNRTGEVVIHVEGPPQRIDQFLNDVFVKKPPLAKPVLKSQVPAECRFYDEFSIKPSEQGEDVDVQIPADLFVCDDCLREMYDPDNRRYLYPFINCTQCGPRYTLITSLPYDRKNTSMHAFDMCPECACEYSNPDDRRFHAEPIACSKCGPKLSYRALGSDRMGEPVDDPGVALQHAATAIKNGAVIAVKGVGGYHIMCDATNEAAVARIRANKPRPDKPLAVMFPSPLGAPFSVLHRELDVDDADCQFLSRPSRPLLLVTKQSDSQLAASLAPGLNEVGVMLPYSPLHHLLLNAVEVPLVATSANLSGEPVLTQNAAVETRLAHVVDACLHHDRDIVRPADDPVFRTIMHRPRPLRLGRGVSPLELELPFHLDHPVLAVGAHMKNTIALGWGKRVVVSPHIGEMHSARSLDVFEQVATDLQQLYQVEAQAVIHDAHPAYTTSRWAKQYAAEHKLGIQSVLHHHAHASAAYGEAGFGRDDDPVLVFTWDGTGYGSDGMLWGGEALLGKAGRWQRVASMMPFLLPGGDRVATEPWRTAASLCWQHGIDWKPGAVSDADVSLLKQAWTKQLNTVSSSAVGRLFDAAAALTGACEAASFEGQGPMLLEAMCERRDSVKNPLAFDLHDDHGLLRADWSGLLAMLMDSSRSVSARADCLHDSMALLLHDIASMLRERHDVMHIGLSGGVFQNRVLCERAHALLTASGFRVYLHETIPANDAGISYGQIVEYAAR